MDFSFTEDQDAVRGLAEQVFTGRATVERVKAVEATEDRVDRELWKELGTTGLLGIGLPEAHGGAGLGLVEVCLVLQQQGRRVAPVPYWPTVVLGALTLAEFGTAAQRDRWLPAVVAGDVVLTAALEPAPGGEALVPTVGGDARRRRLAPRRHQPQRPRPAVGRRGPGPGDDRRRSPVVPRAHRRHRGAHRGGGDHQSGPPRSPDPRRHTGRGPRGRRWGPELALPAGPGRPRRHATRRLRGGHPPGRRVHLRREQFGKALSTNQGVALRAADAYITIEAIRATLWQAAWRLDEGLPSAEQVEVAHWWASDGGTKVVLATQHLHGGMGADIDYPVHRYFLWGKHIGDLLGGPSSHLARLGDLIAEGAGHG